MSMAKNTSILQDGTVPKHTQTLMAELVPVVTSITAEATKNRPGQPTKRTEELVEEICSRLECGQALLMICNDPMMPGYRTVMEWQRRDPKLRNRFNDAREEGAYALDDVAELIARKIPGFATGDYRYDDMLVGVLAQRKRYANRKRFTEKVQVEITDQRVFLLPPDAIDGQGY
ncbi:terminase small subunit-like protein [Sphingobium salicis]|uniref:terminase small subunit-like protein n=1 Tax=Sphingobium sp. HT1-2 TaxID=3111640 RepID=UPI003C2AEAC2